MALISLLCSSAFAYAKERYPARGGQVTFSLRTTMKDIDAVNRKAYAVLDVTSGQVSAIMLCRTFAFKKALLREHFNENYRDSNTWPKAEFKGRMTGPTASDAAKPGTYTVTLGGELDVHGVKKMHTLEATIVMEAVSTMKATSQFTGGPADYGIRISGGVNVAEVTQLSLDMDLKKI